MPIRRCGARRNPNEPIVLDPRAAMATVAITFSEDDWREDLSGENGPERKRYAQRARAKFKGDRMGAEVAMVLHAEQKAIEAIEKKSKLKEIPHQGHRDDHSLFVTFGIDSMADIRRLRALFDNEGRSYDFIKYGEVSGLTLLPQGVNGPILRTDSSPFQRGSDLDEWIDDQPAASRAPRKRR